MPKAESIAAIRSRPSRTIAHVEGIQGIRPQGQRSQPRHRRHHRRGFRQDRRRPGQRHHHADHRHRRQSRLHQLFRAPIERGDRDQSRGRKKAGRRLRLRRLHHRRDQLRHRRPCAIRRDQGDQHADPAGRQRAARFQLRRPRKSSCSPRSATSSPSAERKGRSARRPPGPMRAATWRFSPAKPSSARSPFPARQ